MMTLGRAVTFAASFKSSPTPVIFLKMPPPCGVESHAGCYERLQEELLKMPPPCGVESHARCYRFRKHLIYNHIASSQQRCLLKLINLTNFVLPTAIVSTFVGTLYVTSAALN